MRITKQYFFMCRSCKLLQDLRSFAFEDGDYFVDQELVIVETLPTDSVECTLASSCRCFDTQPKNHPVKVWIPTMNQLVEIIVDKIDPKESFSDILNSSSVELLEFGDFSSRLIRFLMQKLNKTWNPLNYSWEDIK